MDPAAPSRIRIILAEDHHIVRRALRTHLARQRDLAVVADVADGRQLAETVAEHPADILLLDLKMPDHRPVQAVKELRADHPGLRILVLSAHLEAEQVIALFAAGIEGYILKNDPEETIGLAIRHVAAGRSWLSPRVASLLANRLHSANDAQEPQLTPRQQEVLALIARGYRNEQIAAELTLSEHTVRNHIANIFQALAVDNRVEAVVYGLAKLLISLEEITTEMETERDL